MELDQRIVHAERHAPDWPVAAVAGLAAGAILMVLDLVWSAVAESGGPWRTSHMIAPIFTGADAAQLSEYRFSWGVVAIALGVHYVAGTVAGLVLGAIMTTARLDTTPAKAIGAGVLFGVALYFVNFYGIASVFPWLAELRGWPTFAAQIVFGVVAAALYWKLGRTPKAA